MKKKTRRAAFVISSSVKILRCYHSANVVKVDVHNVVWCRKKRTRIVEERIDDSCGSTRGHSASQRVNCHRPSRTTVSDHSHLWFAQNFHSILSLLPGNLSLWMSLSRLIDVLQTFLRRPLSTTGLKITLKILRKSHSKHGLTSPNVLLVEIFFSTVLLPEIAVKIKFEVDLMVLCDLLCQTHLHLRLGTRCQC